MERLYKICKYFTKTLLILICFSKFGFACSPVPDPNNPNFDPIAETFFYGSIYFFASIFVLLSVIIFSLITRFKRNLFIPSSIISAFLIGIISLFSLGIFDSCGFTFLLIVKGGLAYSVDFFATQILLWKFSREEIKLI